MIQPNQAVNKIGKYLYDHLDGAYDFKRSGNTFDVYTVVLYQIPKYRQNPKDGDEINDVHEMIVNISITTYQNKIRVDAIEVTPDARTLGYDIFEPNIITDLENAKRKILGRVAKRISKAYKDFDFLF